MYILEIKFCVNHIRSIERKTAAKNMCQRICCCRELRLIGSEIVILKLRRRYHSYFLNLIRSRNFSRGCLRLIFPHCKQWGLNIVSNTDSKSCNVHWLSFLAHCGSGTKSHKNAVDYNSCDKKMINCQVAGIDCQLAGVLTENFQKAILRRSKLRVATVQ